MDRKINPAVKPGEKRKGEEGGGRGKTDFTERQKRRDDFHLVITPETGIR